MDDVVTHFLSKGTAIIAVIVVIIGFFIKRIVLMAKPNWKPMASAMEHKAMYSGKAAMVYNEIGLYALPVVIGSCIGWLDKHDTFLFGADITTTSGRVFYAAVVGWFSDFIYEAIQKALYKSTGVSLPNPAASIPPVQPPSANG